MIARVEIALADNVLPQQFELGRHQITRRRVEEVHPIEPHARHVRHRPRDIPVLPRLPRRHRPGSGAEVLTHVDNPTGRDVDLPQLNEDTP